jgi:hypothetical protein
LPIANRPGVWVGHRDQPVGDRLAGNPLADLPRDLGRPIGQLVEPVSHAALGLGATPAGAVAQPSDEPPRLAHRLLHQFTGLAVSRSAVCLPRPKAEAMGLNERAGRLIRRSVSEARRLAAEARRAARGRGARAKLEADTALEELAGRCERVRSLESRYPPDRPARTRRRAGLRRPGRRRRHPSAAA